MTRGAEFPGFGSHFPNDICIYSEMPNCKQKRYSKSNNMYGD